MDLSIHFDKTVKAQVLHGKFSKAPWLELETEDGERLTVFLKDKDSLEWIIRAIEVYMFEQSPTYHERLKESQSDA